MVSGSGVDLLTVAQFVNYKNYKKIEVIIVCHVSLLLFLGKKYNN